ncbi:unnamed protein product [Umbelopsis vinacea]
MSIPLPQGLSSADTARPFAASVPPVLILSLSIPCPNLSIPAVEEVQQYLAGLQARFVDLRQYVNQGRENAVATTYRLQEELHSLQTSLVSIDPATAQVLQSIATAKQQGLDNLEQTITDYDARIPSEKEYIRNMLQECELVDPAQYTSAIQDLGWPSQPDLNFLHAIDNHPQAPPQATSEENTQSLLAPNPESQLIGQLMQLLEYQQQNFDERMRQLEQRQHIREQAPDCTQPTNQRINEKRRRLKINKFQSGSATQAQEWLEHFEHACTYGEFADFEKSEELNICLQGPALKWLMGLPLKIKTSWPLLKNAFVHQFGGGDVPARTALLELKAISQGKIPMTEFGPKLTMLMGKSRDRRRPSTARHTIPENATRF